MQQTLQIRETTRHYQHPSRENSRLASARMSATARDKIKFRRAESVTLDIFQLQENRILTDTGASQFSASYQLLHIQVLQQLKENNWNTLAVTSPGAGEGKSLTAINLAISMSREIGYTVVLADLNLREPGLMKHLGLPELMGLGDFLTDDLPIEDLLIKSRLFEDLVILPGGKPLSNSTEMLSSPKMAQLVSDLKSCTRNCILVFDLPPVLTSAEALSFSPLTEAALLVIEDGVTKKHEVEQTVERLSNTNIVGTILNKAGNH